MAALQDGLLREAVALAPATVLRSLDGTGERPEVSLYLLGGQVLSGVLVRIGADHGQDVVVLADPQTDRFGYVLLASVVAVEVRAPERFQDVLTEGRLAQPLTGAPVTLLALRREFAPSAGFPLDVDWGALPDSGPVLANLDRLLRGLREVADDVCADEMGRQAWAQIHTMSVAHRSDVRLSVERAPDGLAVLADLAVALPRDLTGQLRRQVNDLL
jgi:hypothetical protein